VPIGEVPNLMVLADILCCKIGTLPMNYLGMPLCFLLQILTSLESYYRKDGVPPCWLEEVVSVQGWQNHSDQKYVI
jgi:hypothetical protein